MTLHESVIAAVNAFLNTILSILGTMGVIDVFAFIGGLIFIPALTILLGGRIGLRGIVFTAALFPVDRWIGFEHGNQITFHRVREQGDEYEAYIDGEWREFDAEPDRWSKYLGCWFGLLWEKTQDSLEESKASNHWVKGKEYVIDASKELGVLRDAEDPRVLDDVREDVLMRDGGGTDDKGPLARVLMNLGALTIGSVVAILVLVVA